MKSSRILGPNFVAGIVLCSSMCALSVQAGDLTADNITAMKDATVNGSFIVMKPSTVTNSGNPVLYYSFDSNAVSGTVADESQNGNNGTVVGGMTWTNGGYFGGGFFFNDGATANLAVNYGSTLALTGPFSLSVWIKPAQPSNAGAPGIITKGANSSSVEYGLMWSGGNIGFFSTGGSSSLWTTMQPAPTDQWVHVAAVLEGSGTNQAKIYINGSLQTSGTLNLPSVLSGTRPLYVGRWRDEFYYRGALDDVRIYDRALSTNEVFSLFTNAPPCVVNTNVLIKTESDQIRISGQTTIESLVKQGDIEMGVFTNKP